MLNVRDQCSAEHSKYKKHRDRDNEHKKHNHRHKDKYKGKAKEKSGCHDSSAEHSKKHHEKA